MQDGKGYATRVGGLLQEFVIALHERAGRARAQGAMTERAEVLLSLVLDIKNNRQRKEGASAVTTRDLLPSSVFKWLREANAEAVQLHAVSWAKLLGPDKKVRVQFPTRPLNCTLRNDSFFLPYFFLFFLLFFLSFFSTSFFG